jgi:S1 RNA binding domain protein
VDKDGKIGLSIRQAKEPQPGQEGAPKRDFGARGDRAPRSDRPFGGGREDRLLRGGSRGGGRQNNAASRMNFEDKLSRFLKESEDRLSALKRHESKRGGRGGRRG